MEYPIIQYSIIILYFAFIIIKGISKSRQIKSDEDFLVAGRNIGWFLLLATMSATVIGGGSSIGAIGKTYEWGIMMLIVITGWYFQFMFSAKFVAPYFRKAELYTVAGFFGHRFDDKNRFVAFILSLIFSVGVLGAQMVAFGKIISSMMPEIPYAIAVIVGGSIVILYSTAGGLLAVIYTDVYQFIILMAGFIFTAILVAPDIFSHTTQIMAEVPETFFKIDGGKGYIFLISTFLAFLLGETFAPGYATRFCVGKNTEEIKKGIFRAGVFLLITFPVLLFFISLYAKYNFPDIDPEQALPHVILKLHNPFVEGIIIAALMSAVMSSADSILNSTTAIFTKDLYEQYLVKRNVNPKRGLRIARVSSVVLGVCGIFLALLVPDIIELLLLTYSLWAPTIILPILIGVFSKRKDDSLNQSIFIVMIGSILLTISYMIFFSDKILQPSVFGVICSVIIYTLIKFYKSKFSDKD